MAYRYTNPKRQQYQSAFVPLPLDYLNQALQSRQSLYDQNFSGLMQAEDKFAALESAPGAWTDEKNIKLTKAFNDIHQLVQDKYGGDYSQASSDIMRGIASIRKDPFWNLMSQDLLDWKQKKSLRDQLEAQGQLGFEEGFDNYQIKDERGNYVLPKRQIYTRTDILQKASQALPSLFTKQTDGVQKSKATGYLEMVKKIGASPEEIDKAVTVDVAKQIYDESADLRAAYPNMNMEQFRKEISRRLQGAISQKEDKQLVRDLNWISPTEQADINYKNEMLRAKQDEDNKSRGFLNMLSRTTPTNWNEKDFKEFYKSTDSDVTNQYDPVIQQLGRKYGLPVSSMAQLKQLDQSTPSAFKRMVNYLLKSVAGADPRFNSTQIAIINATEMGVQEIQKNIINSIKDELSAHYEKNRPDVLPQYTFNPALARDSKDIELINKNREALDDLVTQNLSGNFVIPAQSQEKSDEILKGIKKKDITNINYGRTKNSLDPKQKIVSATITYNDAQGKEQTVRVITKPEAAEHAQLISNKLDAVGQDFYEEKQAEFIDEVKQKFPKWTEENGRPLSYVEFVNKYYDSFKDDPKRQQDIDDNEMNVVYGLYQGWNANQKRK